MAANWISDATVPWAIHERSDEARVNRSGALMADISCNG